ncbi:MAG: EutN/CcmL family microcompartment protein [Candidatus Eisenbacteria bacterium]|uniref:EutN/CcmL family microcompartment protein n=1 Tax=Eiseniibacteriota bacterium TaxID=2212470 RepID=A0A948RSQ8_UNCEI|nr:EutN/CcmL family microcompartment protein [Candidatus Eisenbacteria bacterium]MBU1951186.1 EutN/CcmL family microcompartment protein [Candidatus Eisenbacteria bacterium]MBU2690318.1 EutN/CcmL family microcompartment protein [Candidatus Eisenbacteria bacterium]
MQLATVLGTVVCTQKIESLTGVRMLWIQPVGDDGLAKGDPLVAADTTRAGPGTQVFYVQSREAAQSLEEPFSPVDAAIVGHVHRLNLPRS